MKIKQVRIGLWSQSIYFVIDNENHVFADTDGNISVNDKIVAHNSNSIPGDVVDVLLESAAFCAVDALVPDNPWVIMEGPTAPVLENRLKEEIKYLIHNLNALNIFPEKLEIYDNCEIKQDDTYFE